MTEKEMGNGAELIQQLEKTALKSKKFIAWFLTQVLLFTLALVALLKQPELGWPLAGFMTGIVFSMCVTTMWLLGKQAAADIALRGFIFKNQETADPPA